VLEEAQINEIKHTSENSQKEKPRRDPMFRDGIMRLYIYIYIYIYIFILLNKPDNNIVPTSQFYVMNICNTRKYP
jgi:hypothetical protein